MTFHVSAAVVSSLQASFVSDSQPASAFGLHADAVLILPGGRSAIEAQQPAAAYLCVCAEDSFGPIKLRMPIACKLL